MPVCKFYLQGYCKFGSNCNFDHPRDQQSSYQAPPNQRMPFNNQYNQVNQQQNRYKYVSNNNSSNNYQNQAPPARQPPQPLITNHHQAAARAADSPILNEAQFLDLLQKDLSEWFNSNAWKLSSYSYAKYAPPLSMLEEISPEEIRFHLYEAMRRGTFNEAYQEFRLKYNQALETIKLLVHANAQTRNYLLNYFHECEKKSASSTGGPLEGLRTKSPQQQQQQQQATQAVNPFMKIVQQENRPAAATGFFPTFPQTTQQAQPNLAPAFQQPHQPFQNNLNTQSVPFGSQSGFGGAGANPFAQLAQPALPVQQQQHPPQFQTQHQAPFFNTTPVAVAAAAPAPQSFPSSNPGSFFFNSQMSFAGGGSMDTTTPVRNQSAIKAENEFLYSKPDELSKEELFEFKSNEFTIGRIPYKPPAREFC